MTNANNKRIAKNTIYLYLRMLIVMIVQLFTMRVVLEALGVEDFGIYNVVAGVVVLFNFLTVTMSGATSRFLTYEMGVGNEERLRETFQTALFLHLCIAIILVIAAETIGLWFVCNKLVIPENRHIAAQIVYQFAIMTIICKTLQVPFNASIISNERMDIYAKIEIANVVLTLCLVYILKVWDGDRLIYYGMMLTIIAFSTTSFYAIYCINKFNECSFRIKYSKLIAKKLLSFSGWDLYGNFCLTARIQGLNIILNLFFGPILNAAASISSSVQGAIITFGSNVITAFRPQIIKKYAASKNKEMEILVGYALEFSLLLFAVVAIPLFIEMPLVLKLWLVNPPEAAVSLTRISIITGLITFITSVLNIVIHATGKIKWLSFISGTVFILIIPLSYCSLKIWPIPEIAYFVSLIMTIVNVAITLIIVHNLLPDFAIKRILTKNVLPTMLIIAVDFILCFNIRMLNCDDYLRVFLTIISSIVIISSLSIKFLLPKDIINELKWKLKNILH